MKDSNNPFVPIPYSYRLLLLLFFTVYYILVPSAKFILLDSTIPYTSARLVLSVIYSLLTFAPILLYRSHFGILHPLILPLLLSIVKFVFKSPTFLVSFLDTTPLYQEYGNPLVSPLAGYTAAETSALEVQILLLNILSVCSLYAGYFYGPKIRTFRLPEKTPRFFPYVIGGAIAISLLGTMLYLRGKGGLSAHFTSFAYGRKNAVGGEGYIHVVLNIGFIATLIWLAVKRYAYQNPAFWIAVLATLPIQFLTRGSRSTLVYGAILLLLVFILHFRKLPTLSVAVLGLVGMMAIGVLGEIRQSTFGGNEVDWSALLNFNTEDALSSYTEEISFRKGQNPDLAVMTRGIDKVGLLWGKTYVGGILFFIPRAIWKDKPHSSGYYTGTLLFNSRGGIPPSAVVEAYWNFHIFGVFLIYFIHGMFLRWFGSLLKVNQGKAAFTVLYVITIFYFFPSNLALIHCFQQLGLVLILLWMLRMIPPTIRLNTLYKF